MSIYDPLSIALGIEPQLNLSYLNKIIIEEHLSEGCIPGIKHCSETKRQISQSNKDYYSTEEGRSRRLKIAENNRHIKSKEMKDRWKDNYDAMKKCVEFSGRKKGIKELKPRQKRYSIKRITDGVNLYEDAYEAAKVHKIHPVNIRRKCRKMIDNWRYI